MNVGASAARKSFEGETPVSPKLDWRIDCPAGFGALAMTVRPPPVTAPATTANFSFSEKPGANVAR